MTGRNPNQLEFITEIIKQVFAQPITKTEACRKSGYTESGLRHNVKRFRKNLYIAKWVRQLTGNSNGWVWTAYWQWTDEPKQDASQEDYLDEQFSVCARPSPSRRGAISSGVLGQGDIQMSQNVVSISGALTPHERRILGYLAKGLTNKDIALEFGRSPETVKTHLTTIFRKLDVGYGSGARLRAVMVAKDRGIV